MEKDIGKIKKNDTADIILRIDDFSERRGLTIREFITSDRYTGFTKSGVKIMAADFPKFKEMINSIPEEDMKEQSSGEGQPETQAEPGQETLETPKETSEDKKDLPDY
ncbi:hypothetical protein KAR52_02035 [Candidatus Pacearchaeota archaeon]|nr:hypothetical protein [Candidatus Pacearchaeota archaeon]